MNKLRLLKKFFFIITQFFKSTSGCLIQGNRTIEFFYSSFIYCLILAGLSLLTTICAKKEQIIIKIDEI